MDFLLCSVFPTIDLFDLYSALFLAKILEMMLYDEESYVLWETKGKHQIRNISFEFRTRLREAQILVLEFSHPSLSVIFGVTLTSRFLRFLVLVRSLEIL